MSSLLCVSAGFNASAPNDSLLCNRRNSFSKDMFGLLSMGNTCV